MTVLANNRRELFAQLLFQGFTAVDAYKKAGYKRHDGNACTLAKHPEILARLEEIRGDGQGWPVGTRAIATRANVTVESLIDDSEKVLQRGMEINHLGAANTAIKGKAILSGKWIERAEIGAPGEYETMTDDELERQIMERLARLGLTDVLTLTSRTWITLLTWTTLDNAPLVNTESNKPESNSFDRAAVTWASRAAVPSRAPLELPTKSRCPVRSGSRGHSGRLQWPTMTVRRPPAPPQ
jgi:hypothetical protein